MVDVARDAHAGAGRDPACFLVTVFAELDERWLRAESPSRARLAALGVDRLILFVSSPYDRARIAGAGQLLAASS